MAKASDLDTPPVPGNNALVPVTSTALVALTEQEQQLTAEVARREKIDKAILGVLMGGGAACIGGGILSFFVPPVGIAAIGVAGVAILGSALTATWNSSKHIATQQRLFDVQSKRKAEQKLLVDETRRREETAYAERVRAAARPVLAKISEKTNLVAGKSTFGFKDPDDKRRKLVLLITEITEHHEDVGDEAPQQRVIARVHRQPEDGGEIAQSPQIPRLGALSILRPMPSSPYRLRLPAAPGQQNNAAAPQIQQMRQAPQIQARTDEELKQAAVRLAAEMVKAARRLCNKHLGIG